MTSVELLEGIRMCDGYEVPQEDWARAEEFVAAGLITLGAARGPGHRWRRAELTTKARRAK